MQTTQTHTNARAIRDSIVTRFNWPIPQSIPKRADSWRLIFKWITRNRSIRYRVRYTSIHIYRGLSRCNDLPHAMAPCEMIKMSNQQNRQVNNAPLLVYTLTSFQCAPMFHQHWSVHIAQIEYCGGVDCDAVEHTREIKCEISVSCDRTSHKAYHWMNEWADKFALTAWW